MTSKKADKTAAQLAPSERKKPRPASAGPRRRRSAPRPTPAKPFKAGTNSHTGEVFRRGPDMIPRGSPKLMFRVALSDYRERIYESIGKLVDTPRGALAFLAEAGDRLEGKPTQRHEVTTPRVTVFQRDDTPAPPPVQGSGGAPTPPLVGGCWSARTAKPSSRCGSGCSQQGS